MGLKKNEKDISEQGEGTDTEGSLSSVRQYQTPNGQRNKQLLGSFRWDVSKHPVRSSGVMKVHMGRKKIK